MPRSSSSCGTARSSLRAPRVIRVEKTGIERWLYNLSRNRPLLYGLASVAAALAAGWLAAEGLPPGAAVAY